MIAQVTRHISSWQTVIATNLELMQAFASKLWPFNHDESGPSAYLCGWQFPDTGNGFGELLCFFPALEIYTSKTHENGQLGMRKLSSTEPTYHMVMCISSNGFFSKSGVRPFQPSK